MTTIENRGNREEHSMDQYRSRLKLSENFECHWSIRISGEIHMDQSLVHIFSWGNSYGPMVLKILLKFPHTLVLVRGWQELFPGKDGSIFMRPPSESVSTGVWRILVFGEPSKLQKEGEKPGRKGHFNFCAKLWYAVNPGSKEI